MEDKPIIIDPPAGYQYDEKICEQWISELEKMDQANQTVKREMTMAKEYLAQLQDDK